MSRNALAHLALACGTVLTLGAVSLRAQQTTTISTQDGGAAPGGIRRAAATTGQTFMTPDAMDAVLVGFEMAAGVPGVAATPATARVAVWDAANERMGTVLWSGTTTLGPSVGYQFYSVGQTLAAGTPYVFALSFALDASTFETLYRPSGDPYPGGSWVVTPAVDLATLQGTPWTSTPFDLAFALVFQPTTVPEPATWTLTGAGLLALAGFASRRRRAVCR